MNGTINLASQSRLLASTIKGKKALKEDFERKAIPHLSYAVSYTHLTLPTICSV